MFHRWPKSLKHQQEPQQRTRGSHSVGRLTTRRVEPSRHLPRAMSVLLNVDSTFSVWIMNDRSRICWDHSSPSSTCSSDHTWNSGSLRDQNSSEQVSLDPINGSLKLFAHNDCILLGVGGWWVMRVIYLCFISHPQSHLWCFSKTNQSLLCWGSFK